MDTPVENNLLAQLVQANYDSYAGNMRQLQDSQEKQIKVLKATINAIRADVHSLFEKPWVPSEQSVIAALYPFDEKISMHEEEV